MKTFLAMKMPRAGTNRVHPPDHHATQSGLVMRTHLSLLLLALSAPAAAQPQSPTCEVTISRAPDDVRDAIEAWVADEERCATTLDVRVIPTDGGYYLFARDPAGRIRERIVPDAQSAGVLVASWVADDGMTPPAPVTVTVSVEAPTATSTRPTESAVVVASAAAPTVRRPRYVTLGGIVGIEDGIEHRGQRGARAELDVWRGDKWSAGLGLSGSSTSESVGFSEEVASTDLVLLATLVRNVRFGPSWDMRLSFAAGVSSTRLTGVYDGMQFHAQATVPAIEISLLLARSISDDWAISFGPALTYSKTKFVTGGPDPVQIYTRDGGLLLFAGLRYGR